MYQSSLRQLGVYRLCHEPCGHARSSPALRADGGITGYYERAIMIYTHTSDQYSVFGARVISCSPREALYVLDGLLENDTTLCPRERYTDTHGFTEQLFGLCFLLGYSFMPRLR